MRCRDLLIQAERSRLEGRASEAKVLYEEAIDSAQKDGFIATFALGNELLGKFCCTRGRKRSARFYLNEAHQAWSRWCAKAKAAALLARYPELITPPDTAPKPAVSLLRTGSGATVALDWILSDLDEAMHAAHDISSEILVEKVVDKFLRTARRVAKR